MKLITRDTDYAVRAISYIAESKKDMVSAGELVAALKIPRPFLRKILQMMNRNDLLASYKGKGGGFKLIRRPREIFITDLMETFQGPLKVNECIFKKKPCPNRYTCKFRKRINRIEEKVASELGSITIADLI